MKESTLIKKIQDRVKELRKGGMPIKCIKLHGSSMMRRGESDLHITARGMSLWLEAKVGGNEPTDLQVQRIREWRDAGAISDIVRSVEDVELLIGKAIKKNERGEA